MGLLNLLFSIFFFVFGFFILLFGVYKPIRTGRVLGWFAWEDPRLYASDVIRKKHPVGFLFLVLFSLFLGALVIVDGLYFAMAYIKFGIE